MDNDLLDDNLAEIKHEFGPEVTDDDSVTVSIPGLTADEDPEVEDEDCDEDENEEDGDDQDEDE